MAFFRTHIVCAHSLPAWGGMAVEERKTALSFDSRSERAFKVLWREASVAMNGTLARLGKYQLVKKGGAPRSPLTGMPDREA
jgi:hypothetical protein